ncbi:MAG: Oxidoreductase, molybdopterin-binding domain-containing protein [Olpidium bornovanus]|uniref:Nitrate reductase [NADPH] n=1 Tax=Olpidium bornovanus TaxID=278681 RepID=A0A8H7ZSB5_9FUNG|nr:MAG: Oxidoreductase, molybdopterin-binding domain-containing protein [Olpidium bornovanus]
MPLAVRRAFLRADFARRAATRDVYRACSRPALTPPLSSVGRQPRGFVGPSSAGVAVRRQGYRSSVKAAAAAVFGFVLLPAAIYSRRDSGAHGCKSWSPLAPFFPVAEAEALTETRLRPANPAAPEDNLQQPKGESGEVRRREFTRAEVSAHDSLETGVWVVHGDGVYDVTDFVEAHPGGDRIMLAAGRSIDPFWNVFTVHNTPETREIFETYRIGAVIDMDPAEAEREARVDLEALNKLFVNEPELDPSFVVRSERPCNAEAARESLLTYLTPNKLFYVRNHLPVPAVDEAEFRLTVDVPTKDEPVTFSMDDLRKFPKHTITASLQCAGNRRKSMHDVKPTKGLQWELGAIGNATWAGARLSDVLASAGYDVSSAREGKLVDNVAHVWFDGAEGYGASVPVQKVVDPLGDVILAYEMNGEPIPTAHGYPLRAVVPGHVAARSVKWVNKITLASEESSSHWQQRDYKGFSPSATLETSNYQHSVSIQEMPVQSAITSPRPNETMRAHRNAQVESQPARGATPVNRAESQPSTVTVRGYAWSGGGRGIVRVDVSADGGNTWVDAVLLPPGVDAATANLRDATGDVQSTHRQWAWTLWVAEVPVPADVADEGGRVEIVCKAVDSSYNTQPEDSRGIYNVRGVLSNAWHRVPVEINLE